MKTTAAACIVIVALTAIGEAAGAESNKEYENRFMVMLDYATYLNDYVRQRLGDKGLAAYAHGMAETNVAEAEKMSPPSKYGMIHPHFLLALENIERALSFAETGELSRYRQHQKVVVRELQLIEALAQEQRIDLYLWKRCR